MDHFPPHRPDLDGTTGWPAVTRELDRIGCRNVLTKGKPAASLPDAEFGKEREEEG